MNVSTGFVYLEKCFSSRLKNIIKPSKEIVTEFKNTGSDILAEQNRLMILRQAENYIEPLKSEFSCTKDMLRYAKQRCIEGLNQGYEHAVVMDIKHNKIIAEFKGDANKCSMKELKNLNLDSENTIIMHGHPENFPLSKSDVSIIDSLGVSQVIAIDSNGEFSLVGKRNNFKQKKFKKAFYDFSANSSDDRQIYELTQDKEEWKRLIDDTLKQHAPKMGLRYITNYGYLINKN